MTGSLIRSCGHREIFIVSGQVMIFVNLGYGILLLHSVGEKVMAAASEP